MTGYGKAEKEYLHKKITVEIRSLNSKQLDLVLRLPSSYKFKEMELRTEFIPQLIRGKVDITLNVDLGGNISDVVGLNTDVFKTFYSQIKSLSDELGLDVNQPEIISTILRLPEVVGAREQEFDEEEWKIIKTVMNSAIASYNEFRMKEGIALMNDILERISIIESSVDKIVPFEEARIEAIRTRIQDELNILSTTVDKNRFEQEMIYYIEKIDITEEKVRLKQHCNYFRSIVKEEDAQGRKLSFVTQEIGREINTLGSKANEANIQKIVVNMKDELEKIKEQLLNIL